MLFTQGPGVVYIHNKHDEGLKTPTHASSSQLNHWNNYTYTCTPLAEMNNTLILMFEGYRKPSIKVNEIKNREINLNIIIFNTV